MCARASQLTQGDGEGRSGAGSCQTSCEHQQEPSPCPLDRVAIRRILPSQWARTCLMLSVPPIIGFNAS